MDYPAESFTESERDALTPHFTNLDRPVFALVGPSGDGEGGAVRALLALPGHAAAALPRRVRRRRSCRRSRLRRRGGRARPQALRAHLPRLRGRLGRAARGRPHRLRVGLERDDEAAPARPAGRVPGAVHALHPLRHADRRGARLPLLARPLARARVRGRDGLPVRRLLGVAAARGGVGRRALPAPRRRARGGPPARAARQGARPAARAAAGRVALAHGDLRQRARPTSSCCCACTPRRCPRRATTRT